MDVASKHLKAITRWAKQTDPVRVMVLIGPRAQTGKADRLAGIDLDLFVRDPATLAEQAGWLQVLEKPWFAHFDDDEDLLVWKGIYEDGTMIALYIQPLEVLTAIQKQLPPYYLPQYKVLVDKDQQAAQFPKADQTLNSPSVPTPECFQASLAQFWLDAYYAVKYLWREDLWRTKHYDWQMKQRLLQMLGWHALVCEGREGFTVAEGDPLSAWVDPETYTALTTTFGRFDSADSWRALEDTVKLYLRLASAVAEKLGFDDPEDWETKFNALTKDLRANLSQ